MDKQKIIKDFIQLFILKPRRERSLFELNNTQKRNLFTGRLNHRWATLLDMKKMTLIPKEVNDYEFIKVSLRIADEDVCYTISNYDDIDNEIMTFEQVFDKCYGRGLATLIIAPGYGKIYLETEQVQGAPDRFISKT